MNLPEQSVWINDIYQIERADPILGGEFGINNVQAKQLASRTQYLLWYLLSFHAPDGTHALKAANLSASSKIPEDRFAFAKTTADVHDELTELRDQYDTIMQAIRALDTSSLAPSADIYEAMLLYWKYGDAGMDFSLFTPEFTFVPDVGRYHVYRAVSGDDSIDVTASETLQEGEEYVLSFADNRIPPRIVTIKQVLGLDRVLLAPDADFDIKNVTDEETEDGDPRIPYGILSRSTWSIENGEATADAGGILMTKVISSLNSYSYGMLDIGHEHGCSGFEVKVRKVIEGVPQAWKDAELVQTVETDGLDVSTWRFEANAPVQFMIKALSGCIVHFMCSYPDPTAYDPQFVRMPYVTGPFKLERYGALYKDPFAKLEITVDTDPDFSTGATTVELTDSALVDLEVPVVDVYADVEAALLEADPPRELGAGTYYWRARYHSESGKKSLWTPVYSFTIEPQPEI